MGKARVGNEGIARRLAAIEGWERQIEVWKEMSAPSKQLDTLRLATQLSIKKVKEDIEERNKTLSFATLADQLDLAKLNGRLDGLESVYYDIAEAPKKIEQARQVIAHLKEEVKRAKKGELLDTGV